ncbi:MAG: alpha/beta hydrolase-fold protein [Pseudomonadota bacterium]
MKADRLPDAELAAQTALMEQLAAMLPGIPPRDLPRFAASLGAAEPYALGPDSMQQPGVARGVLVARGCAPGLIYPGVAHDVSLYVSAQVDAGQPAALMVFQDGARYLGPEVEAPTVLDNLVAQGVLPPLVAVFVNPGETGPGLPIYGGNDNRSTEYDSVGDTYVRFLLDEVLPVATQGLNISADPARRAIVGLSSGGACAFNAAWERPDVFGKVVAHCGSFVDIRGAHALAPAVRRSEPKPLRVFLQTGEHDLDIVFGRWVEANRELAAALAYRGYDHRLVVGKGGHSLKHGGAIFPDTLRWLWR